MKPIQTSRVSERIPITRPPEYRYDHWFNFNSVVSNYDTYYDGNSTIDDPFPIARSFRLWQVEVFNVLSAYYRDYWIPYGLNEAEWFYQLDTQGSWLNLQISAMEFWWEVYNYVKTNYYDISVGEDEVGDTWKEAEFTMSFSNDPIVTREKIIRKLHDKHLYKTMSTMYPSHIETLKVQSDDPSLLHTIKINVIGTVRGENKHWSSDLIPVLIRTPIIDSFNFSINII